MTIEFNTRYKCPRCQAPYNYVQRASATDDSLFYGYCASCNSVKWIHETPRQGRLFV